MEISMGLDPAPFIENLFRYYFENKFILNLKKRKPHKVRSFTNIFRFIDELRAANDKGLFEKQFKEIYREKIELKKENVSFSKVSFLYIDFDVKDNKIATKLKQVKQDSFLFEIARMSFFNFFILCHFENLIYLLTCKNSNIQYVGKTALSLHQKINIHYKVKLDCKMTLSHDFLSSEFQKSLLVQVTKITKGFWMKVLEDSTGTIIE